MRADKKKIKFIKWLNIKRLRLIGKFSGIHITFQREKQLYKTIQGFAVFGFLGTIIILYLVDLLLIFIEDGVDPTNFISYLTGPSTIILCVALVAIAVVTYIIRFIGATLSYNSLMARCYAESDAEYKKDVLSRLKLSEKMQAQGYTVEQFYNGKNYESYVKSDEIDKHLYRNNASDQLRKSKFKFRINEKYLDYVPRSLFDLMSKKNSTVFNGKLLRQHSEISPQEKVMKVEPVRYFDGQFSNEFVYKHFYNQKVIGPDFSGENLLINPKNNELYSMNDSPCANYLGVSTLAITNDNYIIIGQQGSFVKSNADRLSPSGSGSVDEKDAKGCATLGECLIKAMERELCEECNINKRVKITSHIISFVRLLERGGKPDFFGISMVDISHTVLKSIGVKLSEEGLALPATFIHFETTKDIPRVLREYIAHYANNDSLDANNKSCNNNPKISIQLELLCSKIELMYTLYGDVYGALSSSEKTLELKKI